MKHRRQQRRIDDLELMRLWYSRIPDEEMATQMDHNRGALRRRAKQLGLRPRRELWAIQERFAA